MHIDEFINERTKRLYEFQEAWLRAHDISPAEYPLECKDEDDEVVSDWTDIFNSFDSTGEV